MKTNAAIYNEDSIQHFQGLAGVRKKPGMYLGERGNPMALKCVKELVDNALDEFLAGRNSEIEVVLNNKQGYYIVADKAQGIPVGIHKKAGISTLTLIFTELHAGGKFNDKAYSISSGTHGIGAAAVNAVSEVFEVWTHRDNSWWHQPFAKGVATARLKKISTLPAHIKKELRSSTGYGTVIRIVPDQSIISKNKGRTPAIVDVKTAHSWLYNLAMLNKNLKITLTVGSKHRIYLNKVGLSLLLKKRVQQEQLETMGKSLVYESDRLSFAIQWTSYTEDTGVESFVSCSPTRDGGSHVDEFFAALTKSIMVYKSPRDKFTPKDLRSGLIGVLNWNMNAPEFSSQVKDRLTSNLEKSLYEMALNFFTSYFDNNKALARRIIKRANDAKRAKEEFRKVMDGISKINQNKRGVMLPNILASARRCRPHQRELYLVEGESAAGTAKKARDSNFQEVLRLQGKPANGIRKPLAQLLKSKPVLNILSALGYNHKVEEPHKHLRVQKLLCLADADADGPVIGTTKVLTDKGPIAIQDLAENWTMYRTPFKVYSRNRMGQIILTDAVRPEVKVVTNKYVKVYLENGSVLECTSDHKWMVLNDNVDDSRCFSFENNRFIRAFELKPGDALDSFKTFNSGEFVPRSSVRVLKTYTVEVPTKMKFYCLTVPETGNLFFQDNQGVNIGSSNCHINALILTILYRLLPAMFEEGRVYICNAPLYSSYYKGNRYFGSTYEECVKQMPPESPKTSVVRAKGWGELQPEVLEIMAFNPETRNLIQVNPSKGKELDYFLAIMGSDTGARKTLLGL